MKEKWKWREKEAPGRLKEPHEVSHFPTATGADSGAERDASTRISPRRPARTGTHLTHPFLPSERERNSSCSARVFECSVRILRARSPGPWPCAVNPADRLESKADSVSSASRQAASAPAHAGVGVGVQEPLKFARPAAFLGAASLQLSPSHSPFLSLLPSFNLISVFLSIFQRPSDGLFYRQPPICPELLSQKPRCVTRTREGAAETTHTS